MSETAVAIQPQQHGSLLARMASRFGVEPNKMLATLKATAFRGEVSNEQMMALLIVSEQFGLNPWVREIYAFPDKNNGIVPVVGVDGWLRILNEHPQYDGCEFVDGPTGKDNLPEWIECRIFRKDRAHPTVAREYMAECKRGTGPWGSHPRRMLRHKSLIQAARIAMAFVGIYDQDEAERIIEGETLPAPEPQATVAELNTEIRGNKRPLGPPPKVPGEPTGREIKEVVDNIMAKHTPPPLELTPDTGAPSYAYVLDLINKAANADDLAVAEDLIGSVADERQRAELDVELRGKRKALAK